MGAANSRRPLTQARRYLRGLLDEPVLVTAAACALLIVSRHQGSVDWFGPNFGRYFPNHPAARALPYFWWFGACLVLYLGAPLALSFATRASFHRRYGLGLGDWRAGLPLTALLFVGMIPALVFARALPSFANAYPLAGQGAYTLQPGGRVSIGLFAAYEAAYFAYFIGWEFMFRGWMLNALLPKLGRTGALIVPLGPFVLMHLGKPELEALGSILAGLALGLLALRTRSFWYGALLHGAIAVAMDVLSAGSYLVRP